MMHQTLMTSPAPAELSRYHAGLGGCRFCPMCKVAGDVSKLTFLESHSTRARAMMLWRARHELQSLSVRQVELLYQSTLDSISEAWCISHAPVSSYVAEARAAVFEAGLAPDVVMAAVERVAPEPPPVKANMLLLAGEAAEAGDAEAASFAAEMLRQNQSYGDVEVVVVASGALAYALGARGIARRQAEVVLDRIACAGATEVIADGPQTLWTLRRIYPLLGVSLPDGVVVSSLSEKLMDVVGGDAPAHSGNGAAHHDASGRKRAVFLDSRSACLVADSMAIGEAIQPGFRGPESALGAGEVFEAPRRVVDSLGIDRIYSVWSRSLARSSGADDGLWLTYPDLAGQLARHRLQEAKRQHADLLVTDSLLSARHLARHAQLDDVSVQWLPEVVAEAKMRCL